MPQFERHVWLLSSGGRKPESPRCVAQLISQRAGLADMKPGRVETDEL